MGPVARLFFSTIDVTRQVFYRSGTGLSFAIVNLKPIVPGHVLVVPSRVTPRLADLEQRELADLMSSVQAVGRVIERAYEGDALTVACQDGKAAGQSIPHLHFHILPRKLANDHFAGRNDDVYPAIERAEGALPPAFASQLQSQSQPNAFRVDADEDRRPRGMDEMEKEAQWLAAMFQSA